MNKQEFQRIQTHRRFLSNILMKDVGNPDAVKELYDLRMKLGKVSSGELDREQIKLHSVSIELHKMDVLLNGEE